jgi:hypothetical protein
MIKFFLLLGLSFSLNSYAQSKSLDINGQTVLVSRAVIVGGSVTAATLLHSESLKIGRNEFKTIPAGTNLSFLNNKGLASKLNLRGFIITEAIPDQVYNLANGRVAYLNCGRVKDSVAFVEFDNTGELISGCRTSKDQYLLPPNQENEINVYEHSAIRFFKTGLLRSATMTSGVLKLQGNLIELLPERSLDFHENSSVHFFYPKLGERFLLKTEISKETQFYQPVNKESFPVILYENSQVSSAWIQLETTYKIQISAFGSDLSLEIQSGAAGFDLNGRLDRLVLRETAVIPVMEPTYIRSTEKYTGVVSLGLFKPGMSILLPSKTQLFLSNQDDSPRLAGYPEQGQNGFVFFNELSTKPF